MVSSPCSPFPIEMRSDESAGITKSEARKNLGLDESLFTIQLNLGGEGIGSMALLEAMIKEKIPAQVVILGGLSAETKKHIERIARHCEDCTKVYAKGFVSNVNEYLEASDMTMGKAGANSVMESIYLKRFTLVSDQLYPFEGSKPLLEEHGIGKVENNIRKQADIIEKLYENPGMVTDENFENTGITFSSRAFIKMLLEDYQK